jgi:hypothetical protein
MPGWDVTVRPGKEEEKKKKEDNTGVIVVVLAAFLLLLLYGCQNRAPGWGTGHGCVQRDGSRCDQGSGFGGHRREGRGSGHHREDRGPRDLPGP